MKHTKSFVLALAAVLLVMGGLGMAGTAHAASVTVTGFVDADDVGYNNHAFWILAGTSVTATLDCPADEPIDPYLFVYGPDGGYLDESDDDGDPLCDSYASQVVFTAAVTGWYTFQATTWDYVNLGYDDGTGVGTYILTVDGAAGGSAFSDGRLNCDAAAPIVVYCTADGVEIFRVGANGSTTLALQVAQETIDAAGMPAQSVQIAATADGQIRLYKLPTGELQINALNGREEYVVRWQGCPTSMAEVEVTSLDTGNLVSDLVGYCAFSGAIGAPPDVPPPGEGEGEPN